MKKRKKFIPHAILAFLSFIGGLLYINLSEPSKILDIKTLTIPSIIPFFFLIFLVFGGSMSFVFANARRGILIGIYVVVFLILQYLRINNFFYSLLLLIILILIEFLFWKRK